MAGDWLQVLMERPLADAVEYVFRGPLAGVGGEVRENQIDLAKRITQAIEDGIVGSPAVLAAEAATGCHAAGQLVMRHDGRLEPVENVRVGDALMGPDGAPRIVISLVRGEAPMFDVVPVKGDPWRVNGDHVLTVERIGRNPEASVDMKVLDYLRLSRSERHVCKLFRVPVREFGGGGDVLPVPPYILGALLGDGCLSTVGGSIVIAKPDRELIDEFRAYAATLNIQCAPSEDGRHYRLSGVAGTVGRGRRRNPLYVMLEKLGLVGTTSGSKFIPHTYKHASWNDRMELLAGLMDTDGSLSGGTFDYISKSQMLANDVAFVARSLGFAAYVKPCQKYSQTGSGGTYYRVGVSGDIAQVPMRILRKKAEKRTQKKRVTVTGFSVHPSGTTEPFYGFTLDGDGRYLLGDFTVTHNSGKGLSYLVPGVLAALRNRATNKDAPARFVVSTANIALQRQLVTKDIPMLARALGIEIRAAVLKGRSNYVCHERMDVEKRLITEHSEFVKRIADWMAAGGSGDREDLPWPAEPRQWGRVSVGADDCLGKQCPFADRCIANRAAKAAEDAAILVVNHSLLALISQRLARGALALMVDEAHEYEDALRRAQAIEVSESAAGHHAKVLAKYDLHEESGRLRRIASDVVAVAYGALGRERAVRLRPGWCDAVDDAAGAAYRLGDEIEAAMSTIAERMRDDGADPKDCVRVEKQGDQAARVARRFGLIASGAPEGCAWVEADDRHGCALHYAPIEVSGPVQFPAVVMVSATLQVAGRTAHMAKALGYGAPREAVVPSPWPIAEMAVAIVPRDAPDPSDTVWEDWADGAAVRFVRACGGGALVLATSHRRARAIAEALRGAGFPFAIRVQGEAGRSELADWMRSDRDGVLVGTRSLFQGLDVQGDALRAVLIDRIPFPSPGEPLEQAICERIEARGGNAFRERSLVIASNLLRQAAGRLLRAPTDRGAVCVLDRRILGKFRRPLLTALAPMPVSGDIEDAGRILRGEPVSCVANAVAPAQLPLPRAGRPGRAIAPDAIQVIPDAIQETSAEVVHEDPGV